MCAKSRKNESDQNVPTEVFGTSKRGRHVVYRTDTGNFTLYELADLKGWKPTKIYNRYRTYGPGKLVLSDEEMHGKLQNDGNAEWQALGTEPRGNASVKRTKFDNMMAR